MKIEDFFPCIHLIYEFDPTYREEFLQRILSHRAQVFVSPVYFCDYTIIPGPLCEKLDDEYVILRLRTRKDICLDSTGNWKGDIRPYYLSIEYFKNRADWKRKREDLTQKRSSYLGYLNPTSFQQLYEFNFLIKGTP